MEHRKNQKNKEFFSGKHWLLLVDYDNICTIREEKNTSDTEINLEAIIEKIINALQPYLQINSYCELRLYGGWSDEIGRYTKRALQILATLYKFRRKTNGYYILPVLVETAATISNSRIIGSLRTNSKRTRQKMVDTLLTVDLLIPRVEPETCIAVISSDDDFVPSLIASIHSHNHPVILVRHSSNHPRPNDNILARNNIKIIEWEKK